MKAGSITFSTALDNEQLEKDLQSLTKKIEKKEREIAELTEKRDQAQKKGVFDAAVLDEEKAKLQELKDRLADLRNMSKDKSYDLETREGYAAQISDVKQALEDQRTRVNALQKEWNQTESAVERYTSELAEAEAELYRQQEEADGTVLKIKEAEDRASKLWMEIKKAKSEVESLEKNGKWFGDKEYDAAYRKLTLLIEQIKEYKRQLEKTPEQLKKEQDSTQRELNKAMEAAKKETAALEESIRLNKIANEAEIADQSIASLVKRLEELKKRQKDLELAGVGLGYKEYEKNAAEISQITEDLKAHRAEIEQIAKSTGNMKEETEKARKRMDALGKRLKEILASAFIFNVLSAGLRQFTGWLGKSIKTNEEARQSIAQLKGALLTLAQPLVEIIIPAFTLFVNILTRIITAVAQFVSSLFGKTIKQSKDGAKALYKEANAIGAVGEAADEAAGSLAGFDEINTINTENAKGAGGGGGAGDEIMPDFDFNQEGLDWLSEILGESAKWVATALLLGGIALVAIGACMGNLLLVLAGLFLLGAGITIGEETGALQSWIDALGLKNVAEFVVLAILLAGIAIVAIGAATGNIFMVLAGLVLIGTTIAYANASGMMKSWAEEQVSRAASYVTAALLLGGIALVVIGAATANILMVLAGLGLLAAGIYVGLESETLEAWAKVLGLDSVFDYVVAGIQLAGIALIAIGAAMANIAMVIAGGIILGIGITAELIGEEALKSWWEILKLTTIQQWVGVVLLLGGIAQIAIGAAMANILMVLAGIGMLAVGTVVAATDGNLKSWVEVLELGKIMNWVTTALLLGGIALIVFGIVSGNILMILAGLGLLGAGVAVGTTSGTFQKWIDAIIKGLKDLKRDAKAWWDSNMAKFFTLEYWEGLGKDVIDGFMDGLKNAWDGLTSWFSGVWDDLFGNRKVSVGINRSGNFGSGGSGSFGGSRISASAIPPLPASKIPALARGAVIPPNREFLAVLGDQRNGNNLEAPEDLIRQIVREESGGGSTELIQLLQAILNAIKDGHVIMVGETVLGRTTIRAINNITISSGKQMLKI